MRATQSDCPSQTCIGGIRFLRPSGDLLHLFVCPYVSKTVLRIVEARAS